LAYDVSGSDTRGVAIGTLVASEGRAWHLHGVLGRFFRTGLGTPDYTFVDGLEVARSLDGLQVGLLVDAHAIEDERGWLAGPLVRFDDRWGGWAIALRTGDQDNEVRLIRTLDL
jgi:hypothetical protein